MGLLDDLQSEVEKIKAEEKQQNIELEAQEAFYRDHLKPVMLRAHKYLGEIVENLKIVLPDINPRYPLNAMTKRGVALKQCEYEYDFDSGKNPRQIDLRCNCILEQPLEFHVPTKDAVLKHTDVLESYKFAYHRKDYRDEQHDVRAAAFSLEGPMRVYVRVLAHPADRCINILRRNHEHLPDKRYKFLPEELDDELLERLARLFIREESTLVTVEVGTDLRDELRERLEEERLREEEDMAEALAEQEAERKAEEYARFVNRAKRAIARWIASGRAFLQGLR